MNRADTTQLAGWALMLFGLSTCKVRNLDHCLHKQADSNAWCAQEYDARRYCSPCESANHGCVAQEPTNEICPDYSGGGSDETSGTGTETSTSTGTSSDASTRIDSGSSAGTSTHGDSETATS